MAEGTQRKLAAILVADIVGYSRLMGADEVDTLSVLRQLRTELFGPTIAGHRGKLVKSMGDGWLVEFTSTVDAVNCAMQIQDRLADHATIKLRIGVHIGDVMHDNEDIFGDGVNVAARLEAIAEPGGIAISEPAYSSLDGTLAPSFDDAGEQKLKNIERPLRIWTRAPRNTGSSEASKDPASGDRANFPALAIQPIATSDERAEVRELADALTSDLDAYLGSLRWLVTNTVDTPNDQTYVLRVALRSRGHRLRLEARLFAPGDTLLWSGKFDGALADNFDWQDSVGEEVAAQVRWLILDAEKLKLSVKSLDEMTPEECLLRGMVELTATSSESYASALSFYKAAIDKDPSLVEAYAEAIFFVIGGVTVGWIDAVGPYLTQCEEWVEAATPLASSSSVLDLSIAIYNYVQRHDVTLLRAKIDEVLRRTPFDVRALVFSGWGYIWLGEPEKSLDCFRKSARLGSFGPYKLVTLGGAASASVQIGEDDAAIDYALRGIEMTDGYPTLYRVLASAYAHLDRLDDAASALSDVLRLLPDDSITAHRARVYYGGSAGSERYFEGLRLAGMPE